ncbi:MAG: hypothetical protein ACK2U5_06200 [Candidatus Promineifilaceae bacterium]
MSLTSWTTEQMLSLAPDALMARAAERLANPHGWLSLGCAGGVMWGEFPNANKEPYRVLATLPDLAFQCDCPARKQPCRHAVGLALLAARESEPFVRIQPPGWVLKGLHGSESAISSKQSAVYDEALSAYRQRLQMVRAVMDHFERWLKDSVHNGLADLPARPAGQWNEMASRLSDGGAPVTAQALRDLRPLAGSRPGWPEAVLRRLGRFYLLTQGFAAYDDLPPEPQADLRAAVGWFEDPQHRGDEVVNDEWRVLGSVHELLGQNNIRRTWLYGRSSRRFAFFRQTLRRNSLQPAYLGGTTLSAALRFAPGGWPQRAVLEEVRELLPHTGAARSYDSLRGARDAYGKALSLNPWLRRFPLVLHGIHAHLEDGRWMLRDSEGYVMPLPQPFLYGWHLQAMDNPGQYGLFGEWDGMIFTPISAYYNQTWLALRVLRGQK